VSNEVIRRATVPVLIQKFRVIRELGHVACEQVCAETFAHVLYPTDFSDCAQRVFRIVKRLKAAGAQKVTVLHVQDERAMIGRPREQLAEFDREDRERLEALCRALVLFGLQADFLLRHGNPVKVTLEAVEEVGPCMIALGSQGRSAWQEMLVGSVTENITRLTRVPVPIVRCPEQE
jgi:nucleotide-binding universal stress UspA family protein